MIETTEVKDLEERLIYLEKMVNTLNIKVADLEKSVRMTERRLQQNFPSNNWGQDRYIQEGDEMIPFILGIICGFALATLIFVIFVVAKASSLASRSEEGWINETMDESN